VVVDRFREWLTSVDVGSLSDRERVDLVASLERVKGAACSSQARATDSLRCSRTLAAPAHIGRSVGSMVALARRESPSLGDRFVGLARALVHEMPHTMAALAAGECGERVAVAVVAATATLSREDRGEVDARVGPLLRRLGVRAAGSAAARVAAELDAASVVARMEAAVRSRGVSVRPAPDGMAYLSVLGPLKDVVGAHAALQARSRAVVGGQCPQEGPEGRGVGAVAADTALRLLSGREVGQLTPVEVHLVMTDRALLGTGDPGRSVFEPVRIPGHGSVPAPVARAWLRAGLEGPSGTGHGGSQLGGDLPSVRVGAAPPGDPAGTPPAASTDPAARVWVRRLYATPDGRDLVAMDSRRRRFGGLLRRMLLLRDDICTTPWCEAPIVHADHTTPAREGGATSFTQGAGKCARCNQTKEAPGWRHRVSIMSASELGSDSGSGSGGGSGGGSGSGSGSGGRRRAGDGDRRARRVVLGTTPLGHTFTSEPPPLLGWGSDDVVQEPDPAAASAAREPRGGGERQLQRDALSRPERARRHKRPLRRLLI